MKAFGAGVIASKYVNMLLLASTALTTFWLAFLEPVHTIMRNGGAAADLKEKQPVAGSAQPLKTTAPPASTAARTPRAATTVNGIAGAWNPPPPPPPPPRPEAGSSSPR